MAGLLQGQTAIITGAGRGIGAAAAAVFAREGANVVASDRDKEPLEAVVAQIKQDGGEAIAVPGDITDPAFPEALVRAAIDAYKILNIIVNNAGYTWDGVLHKMGDEQWQAMLEVHNTAPFRLVRAAAPYMREKAKEEISAGQQPANRCIINVSSTSGLHGNAGQSNYACAKMGVVGFTKTIAKEWGQFGIRCNAVAFGFIETRLTQAKEKGETVQVGDKNIALGIPEQMRQMAPMLIPLARTGTPEEAAGGLLLLATPYASYITGHTLEVTGGAGI